MNAVLEAREPSARYLAALEPPLLGQFNLIAQAPNGVARLRELILTLAVQGKLVPQDPNDEPASVLLERISAEKARLVNEGKIRKDKPLAAISDDEKSFALPLGWEWVRTSDLCTLITDGDHQAPPKADSGVPFLVIGDVKAGTPDLDNTTRFVPKSYFDSLDWGKKPTVGDVLYTTVGSFGIPVPVLKQENFCFQRHIALFRPAFPELQPFLTKALSSCLAFQQAEKGATGTAQKTVPLSALRDMRLPLPPLHEQHRIVACAEELMALCDALETKGKLEVEQHARLVGSLFESLASSESPHALAENWQRIATHFDLLLDRPAAVDALEQTILQLAVRGLLVPQDPSDEPASVLVQKIRAEKDRLIAANKIKRDKPLPPISDEEKPFELPGGWEWVRLGTVADVASNLVSPEQHQDMLQVAPDCIEKATGHLLERRTVKDAGVTSPNHRFYAGQILYSKIRPSLSKAVVVDFEGLCSADMYPLNSWLDTGYLHRYILSQPFLDQVRTAENRVKMPKLNQEALNAFLVPVPPLPEQSRIVARIAELRELCTKLRQRLTFAQQTQSRLADALVASVAI